MGMILSYQWKRKKRSCRFYLGELKTLTKPEQNFLKSGFQKYLDNISMKDDRNAVMPSETYRPSNLPEDADRGDSINENIRNAQNQQSHTVSCSNVEVFHPDNQSLSRNACYGNTFTSAGLFSALLPHELKDQQTFNMWKAVQDMDFRFTKFRRKRVIYIQPLDTFPDFVNDFQTDHYSNFFELLQQFLSCFFEGMDVQILTPLDSSRWQICRRTHKTTGHEQLLVGDLNKNLGENIPPDGYCVLGLTWTDLYPCEELNFVLGEASFKDRSAVFCFGRREPITYQNEEDTPDISGLDERLIWQFMRVVSHEACHVFGLAHCVYFRCSMNESSSLQEALAQPLFLCPVCIAKLQRVCRFRLLPRYQKIRNVCQCIYQSYPSGYLKNAIDWLDSVIKEVKNASRDAGLFEIEADT